MTKQVDPQTIIISEVSDIQARQRELDQLQDVLSKNEQFRLFIQLSKSVNEKMAQVRSRVEEVMIPAYKAGQIDKTVKGDWGSVTITESDQFEIDENALPAKFFKKVVDTTKIRGTYQLEGKAPKGTKQFKKFGIMMKLK